MVNNNLFFFFLGVVFVLTDSALWRADGRGIVDLDLSVGPGVRGLSLGPGVLGLDLSPGPH